MSWLRWPWAKAAASVSQGLSLIPAWLENVRWTLTGAFLTLARDAYAANAVAYSCLKLLGQSVPEPPLEAYAVDAAGTREKLPEDHPLQKLLQRPNELQTQYELVELITLQLGICGRSFWWKERGLGGQPVALWPLRPDRVGPAYSTSRKAGERLLSGWHYRVPGSGETVTLPRSDVLAFNFPDPAGESGGVIEGLGPIQVLAREIEADNEATGFVGALLKNYASPQVLLKTKTPIRDKETAERIKRHYMAQFGGPNRGMPALLDADTELEKISFDLSQLEFPNLRAISETRIAAALGVPAILVGLKAGLDRGTYSNYESARQYFAEVTLTNYWRRLSDQFTNDLAADFDPTYVCDFDTTKVRALAAQRLKAAEPTGLAFKVGAATVNEYRKALGLEEIDGGDVFYVPTTLAVIPLGEAGASPQSVTVGTLNPHAGSPALPPGRQPPGGEGNPPAAPPSPNGRAPANAPPAEAAPVPKAKAAPAHAVERRAQAARESRAAEHEPRIAAALDGMRAGIFAALRAEAKAVAPEADSAALRAALEALWRSLIDDAAADAAEALKLDNAWTLPNPKIDSILAELATRVTGIDETTRDGIRDLVSRMNANAWSVDQLAAALRDAHAFSPTRAQLLARTESGFAYNKSAAASYREHGVRRVRIFDGDSDAPCAAVNGTIKTLEWFEANPLQHPNCRRAAGPLND